jgi:putative two-component system response regulator
MALRERYQEPASSDQPSAAVLIVDDDAAKRLAIRAMLSPLVCDIVEADSGRAALRAVIGQPFAVIVMDVRMPSLDGYATAKLIRDRALTPIIFMTAYGSDEADTVAAYASGAVDFIFTPIDRDALRAKISVFIDLFVQSEELRRSLESLTALHALLTETELRAQAVLDSASDGIVAVGKSGRIEVFSTSAQRLFGYSEDEVIGQPLRLIIAAEHQNDRSSTEPTSSGAPNGSAATHIPTETVGRRKDGSFVPIEIRTNTNTTQLDQPDFMVACISDISGRKEQAKRERVRREADRREAQRDRIAFDEAPIGSLISSATGEIERVNEAMCKMIGYTADELIGTSILQITHPDDRQMSAAVLDAMRDRGADTHRFEKRYTRCDGGVVEASVVVSPIHAEGQQVTQVFTQVQDVTGAHQSSRELEEAQFEMLARLAAAAELRDDATGEHTRNVGELAAAIAEQLELPQDEVRMIRFAAPLHDIGKLAVPDAIWGKRGKLTTEEFEVMKTHSAKGAQMLAGSNHHLLKLAQQIALTHHERWDGSGYPAGLAGEAIPIAGRIAAVADVFDALTHTRPYKHAWSAADAVREMTTQVGLDFDPQVLQAFLRLAPAEGAPSWERSAAGDGTG